MLAWLRGAKTAADFRACVPGLLKPGLHCHVSINISIICVNRELHKHKQKHKKKDSFPFSYA